MSENEIARACKIVETLEHFYGALPSPPRDPFIVFVWEVLSIQSTPRKRDAALAALKRIRALTPDAMARTAPAKVEAAVKLAGSYFEQRMRALRAGVDVFRRSPRLARTIAGPLPAARRALDMLPRLGEGSTYRMLLFAAGQLVLPVDSRVTRVALRLGYGRASADFRSSSRSVQRAVANELPRTVDAYKTAYLFLSHHGAATCTDTDPHCAVCPVLIDCPWGRARSQPAAR